MGSQTAETGREVFWFQAIYGRMQEGHIAWTPAGRPVLSKPGRTLQSPTAAHTIPLPSTCLPHIRERLTSIYGSILLDQLSEELVAFKGFSRS